MKRRNVSWSASQGSRPLKRRRYEGPNQFATRMPVRSYPGSMVPMASRGYRPNKTEWKVTDITPQIPPTVTYAANTTGVCTPLCIPTIGADMQNRIGRKIQIKSFYVRGYISTIKAAAGGVAGTTAAQQVRMIVLADLQPNGVLLTPTDVLGTSFQVQSQLNLNNRDRFKVYTDKTFVFDPYQYGTVSGSSVSSATNQIRQVKVYKKINLETVFNGSSTGGIADISSGALYIMFIGSQASTEACAPYISTRVRYSDD